MKPCSCCGTNKALDEFQIRRASKDGRTASCKDCLQRRDKKRYPNEREHRQALSKSYSATPQGKAAHKKAHTKWILSNRLRRAVHIIFNNAIRDGKVKRRPCWVCGKHAEAHHPDYSAPLDVVWLCRQHHVETHALLK